MKRLLLFFSDKHEYQTAKIFFDYESDFQPCKYNNEFKCIYFEEQRDCMDALESAIEGELTEHGFKGFYFDAE